MSEQKTITIKQVRSEIGTTERQRQSLRALGLKRLGRTVTVRDNAATQGLIRTVAHLVEVNS